MNALRGRAATEKHVWVEATLLAGRIEMGEIIEAGAIEQFIADYNDHPDMPKAAFEVGEQYYELAWHRRVAGRSEEKEMALREAINVWEKMSLEIAAYRMVPEAHILAGECYKQLYEYEKAIEHYRTVVDQWPEYEHSWSAQFQIGHLHGKLEQAGVISRAAAEVEMAAAYQRVVDRYPQCRAAKAARSWLSHHNSKKEEGE